MQVGELRECFEMLALACVFQLPEFPGTQQLRNRVGR